MIPKAPELGFMGKCWSLCWLRSSLLMPAPFPPGAIRFVDSRPPSRWREFAFMLHQLQHCIQPRLDLSHSLINWPRFARELSESPRERKFRLKNIITQQVSAYGV